MKPVEWVLAALAALAALAWLRGRNAAAPAPAPAPGHLSYESAVAAGVVTSGVVGAAPRNPIAVPPPPKTAVFTLPTQQPANVPKTVTLWAPSFADQVAKIRGSSGSSAGAPSSPFVPTPATRINGGSQKVGLR